MHSFAKIGLHLDLRVQVPPLPALCRIAEEAAGQGINTLIVEWEASFPYQQHAVISSGYCYTPKELAEFIQKCDGWGLEVIPLQQCFGHVEYILRHDRYAALREDENDLCQVCPCKGREAVAVFADLFREIAVAHPSPYLHIGGDETYLLGRCPACRERAEREGKSRLYVDYFRELAQEAVRLGKRPMLWVDMLLKHPEAASEMPKECVFIDWNYGWAVDRFGDFAGLSALPFEFWGAVAMRSAPDNHSHHGWRTHLDNFRDYIPVARKSGFHGMILTSWSTSGVYGYEWEQPGRPLALYPLRRVTPHAGLPLLQAAFVEAATSEGGWEGEEFMRRYAMERFGFTEEEAGAFCEALFTCDHRRARDGSKAQGAQQMMEALKPLAHKGEFARYRLMVRLTAYDEQVSWLEAQWQSPRSTLESKAMLTARALTLQQTGEALSSEFDALYAGELYPSELIEEADYRLSRIRQLVGRMAGRRSRSSDFLEAQPVISAM